jgi:hypothetical protein
VQPLGVAVTEVLDSSLGCMTRMLQRTPRTHSTFTAPLANAIGALSRQSPLRLIGTMMQRRLRRLRPRRVPFVPHDTLLCRTTLQSRLPELHVFWQALTSPDSTQASHARDTALYIR